MFEKCIKTCPIIANNDRVIANYEAEAASPITTQARRESLITAIAAGIKFRERLLEGCATHKPLTMRTTDENTTYTVTLCKSEAVPVERNEPVRITRTPA